MQKKPINKNNTKKTDANFALLFGETSKITGSLVFTPIVVSLIGVFADKNFGTTPLFTLSGIVLGFAVGLLHAVYLSRKYLKT
jgi:F0F1-type ATP synthase assembly protein I